MAYQKVGTPRFYINILEWLSSQKAKNDSANYNGYYPKYYPIPESSANTHSIPDIFKTHPIKKNLVTSIGVDVAPSLYDETYNYNIL